MSAFRIVHLLPPANVPAQHPWRQNAFVAQRGENTAMRPYAKSLWTFASIIVTEYRDVSCNIAHLSNHISPARWYETVGTMEVALIVD